MYDLIFTVLALIGVGWVAYAAFWTVDFIKFLIQYERDRRDPVKRVQQAIKQEADVGKLLMRRAVE